MKIFNKEQTKVLESKADRLLVSASAGSGKTTVMIEKIIGLIRDGESLKNMLVSTFTKAAAADMRSKLYDALFLERANPHIKEELEYLQSADITNLHSWCQRQISQYFYRLGVDPGFSVLDESAATVLQNECLERVIEEEIERGDAEFLLFYDILTVYRNDRQMREYIKDIYRFALMQPSPEAWLYLYKQPPSKEELRNSIQEILSRKRKILIERALELEKLNNAAGFARNQPFVDELISYLRGHTESLTKPSGRIQDCYRQLNEAFAAIKEDAKEFAAEAAELSSFDYTQAVDPKADILSRMAMRLWELYAATKAEKSVLDFSDLEHLMLKLLEDAEASLEIEEKYKYIFVDEYQDISPLQEAILEKISAKSKMFYVGDVKQSIYAFRGCEPVIFLEKYHAYQREGAATSSGTKVPDGVHADGQSISKEVVKLNSNYRSDSRILQMCNLLFGEIMTLEFGGIDCAKDGAFVPNRGEIGCAPEIVIVRDKINAESELPPVYSVMRHADAEPAGLITAEQNLVVRKVLELMQQDITEKEKKRPVNLSDIVILVRSGGNYVSALKNRLESASIDVSIGEKLNFLSEHITVVLIQYLELINNFDNDIALLSVMRSVFGGFTDAELAEIRAADTYSEYFYEAARGYAKMQKKEMREYHKSQHISDAENEALSQKLQEFFCNLEYYYRLSLRLPVDRLLGAIIADADYFKHAFAQREGKAKAELLENFLRFVGSSPYKNNIALFLFHFSEGADSEVCPPKSGAVRIMTVHASKGLEFPFVIFPNISKRFNVRDSGDRLILDKKYGICLKNWDTDTRTVSKSALWSVAGERLKKTMLEEELRILYVALTRAEQGLFIFGSIEDDNKQLKMFETGKGLIDYSAANNFLTWFFPLLDKYAKYCTVTQADMELECDNSHYAMPLFSACDKELLGEISTRMKFSYPYKQAIRKTFVTAAAKTDVEIDSNIKVLFDDENVLSSYFSAQSPKRLDASADKAANKKNDALAPRKKVSIAAGEAMKRGSAFHKAMELVDFSGDFDSEWEKLDSQTKQLCDYQTIKSAAGKMGELCANNKTYKELPFILNCPLCEIIAGETTERVLIQGVIDLLILTDNGAIIVDYKTSREQNLSNPEYKKQVQIYSKAVADILKIRVKSAYLYSFVSGKLLAVDSN